MKVPRNERSRELRNFCSPGTNGPRNESSREQKVLGTKVPHRDYSFLGTKGLGHEKSRYRASALPSKTDKHENRIFTQMLYQCITWVQPAVWFLLSFWPTMLCDSLNHAINAFGPQGCWGHGSAERKWTALQELDCVACTVHRCTVFWVSYFTR